MNPWTLAAIVIFVYMNLGFIFSLTFKRNDVADMMWGPGFLLTALALNQGLTVRTGLILAATALWSVRLTGYVMYRNLGHTEDWRYKAWRDAWGKYFLIRSYFQVWILQGVLMYAIFYPIGVQMLNPNAELNPVYFVGLALWLFGFVFEAVGDDQLRRFKKKPESKGQLMRTGLWSITRHPNYFGEATLWWGFAIAALDLPYGLYAPLSAVLITFMLLKVSGVAMLEKNMSTRPGFKEYAARTSPFFPWWPKAR